MARDHMGGQRRQRILAVAYGEILERPDADMAGRDPGQDRAGQPALFAPDLIARCHRGQRAGGGHAHRRHEFADQIFAQDRSHPGAPVAPAGERRGPRSLELQVEARAVGGHDLSKQDGAAVAQLRHEAAELVPGISLGQGRRALRHGIARQHLDRQRVSVQPQPVRQRPVQRQQAGSGHGGGVHTGKEPLRHPGIAVVETDHLGLL